ncbi:MAG: hypothetical protein ACI9KE_006079, partial [Polyangiales bacterium]
ALACGDDDGATTRRDGGLPDVGSDSAMEQDAGPTTSCMSDGDCPADLFCEQTTFTCGPGAAPVCSVATCEGGVAATCEGDIVVDCAEHGGSCSNDFEDENGNQFGWCDCGMVPDGQLTCTGDRTGVFCLDGVFGQRAECDIGTLCLDESDGVMDSGCYCDDIPDGICPDPGCVDDLDCMGCTPNCDGATCGDNGCGGSCGSCGLGQACSSGSCVSDCTPRCRGRDCGSDGCGGTCGTCSGGDGCADGSCVGECTPNCSGRSCGSNGCGGSCGTCSGGQLCNDSGACVADCVPNCSGRECGSNGCGGSCGACSGGESCDGGSCIGESCGSGGACASPAVCSGISSGGERCSCIGDEQTYTFDGSALDFSGALRSARVSARQIYDNDTSPPRSSETSNFRTNSDQTLRFLHSCAANVEITRTFSYVVGGSVQTCRIGPETYSGQNSFTLTMPSGEGSGCSAPRL